MATTSNKEKRLINAQELRVNRRRLLGMLAVVVAFATSLMLMLPAITMTHGDLVCGLEEHEHTEACYEQVLVCGYDDEAAAAEAQHEHADACYDTRLICETPEHVHSSACYDAPEEPSGEELADQVEQDEQVDASGALLAEGDDAAVQGDASGEAGVEGDGSASDGAESAAGADGTAEFADGAADSVAGGSGDAGAASEDVVADGAADDGAATVDAAADVANADASGLVAGDLNATMPVQAFDEELRETDADGNERVLLRVHVEAPEGAFPADTTMRIEPVESVEVEGVVDEAVAGKAKGRISELQAVDITFFDADGNKVEPAKKITVRMVSDLIAKSDDTLVVHVDDEGAADLVKPLTDKQLEKRKLSAEGDEVVFDARSFSTYVLVGTTIEKTVLASDGNNYRVTVTGEAEAGIPDDAELVVEELLPEGEGNDGEPAASAYDEYLARAEDALGLDAGSAPYARLFDIKIVDASGQKVQPADGRTVDVKIELADAERSSLSVVHFAGGDETPSIVGSAETSEGKDNGQIVEFQADGFSVYVVVDHEGGTVVTPRVEFHFIDKFSDDQYAAGVSSGTPSAPYNFVNTDGTYQTTQILTDGEALELITDPPNVLIDDGEGNRIEKYFYGWYVVDVDDPATADTTTLDADTGKYTGSIDYTWPGNPDQISFERPIEISVNDNEVTWSINGVTGTGIMDAEGTAHVYLAPLYEDFHFINFHKGPKNDGGTGIAKSLMARKLVVFGSADSAEVRIGNVICESPDPTHKIFSGWETITSTNETDEYYQTVQHVMDESGSLTNEEVDSPEGRDGYYITVQKSGSDVTVLDLYPVFDEARWLYFNTGTTGNGASYVGAAFRLTNDERQQDESYYYFDNAVFAGNETTQRHMSSRPGYTQEGWYLFANVDTDGNITNLDEPQDVTVKYLDNTGTVQTTTIKTKAIKVVDSDGVIQDIGTWYVAADGTISQTSSSGSSKLFEVDDSGKLRFYKAMNDMTLYAHWVKQPATYRVVVWKQKVTDEVNAADADKKYDYEIFYTSGPVDTSVKPNLTNFSGSYVDSDGQEHTVSGLNLEKLDANNPQGFDYTGFHYSRTDIVTVGNPNPDGTTVYNVYYDRDVHSLTFQVYGYVYTVSTNDNDNDPAKYGDVNGQKARVYWRNGAFRTTDWNNGLVYNGAIYTRSNSQSWYSIKTITALYGQNIAEQFPIHGTNGVVYDNGERWDPQSNPLGWDEVMVIVDTMPDADVTFHLDTANRPLKTMNYYVQVLPGETGNVTRNGISYKLYNSVSARYNGVTSEDFLELDGYTKNGWTDGNGNSTAYSSKFYIYSNSQNQTINFFYKRNQYDLTFDVNYPVDANLTYSNGKSDNLTVSDIYYQYPLTEYGSTTESGKTNWYYGVENADNTAENALVGPDHYIFGGWYEDAACTKPFDFDSTMPVGNKIVYAKWTPEVFLVKIDPNGGEIDHINHGGYGSFGSQFADINVTYTNYPLPNTSNYNRDKSTYIRTDYGETVSEYSIPRRFVAMSDRVAEEYEDAGNPVYYYLNWQWKLTDGASGIYSDVRSALYLTESEIRDYYDLYAAIVDYSLATAPATNVGMTKLDYGTWKSLYVSSEKYRPLNSNESWTFLGWYKDDETMPYNFSDPVTGPFTLTAHWRLDGGYAIEYVPQYTMPDGAVINGTMPSWRDPTDGNLTYADGAETKIYKQPTELTRDGEQVTDDSVIFRGWALVSKTGTDENPVYTPLETDENGNITTYYSPSDFYTVNAANAGADSKVYFQAIYQYKDSSDRRPKITNLVLDANTGYVNSSYSGDLPEWDYYPGTSAINTVDHMTTVDGNSVPTQIEFGDIQSSAAVHLHKYATELRTDASGNPLEDSHQFFTHPDGYFLLGFDDGPTEGDYIATYPADSVIAITRDDNQTIYAVWEPMVYVTFKNETGKGDVSFSISSESTEALEVINVKDGMYDRKPLTDLGNVTVKEGESLTLAFPKGAEKDITISGTNTLGVGNVLIWNTSLDLVENGETTSFDSADQQTSYSHSVGDDTHTHELAEGEVNNTKPFTFDERLIVNENPLVVTFTSRDNAYALVLDDNYEGGGIQEYDYSPEQIAPENGNPKSQELPSTSTRVGYEFQGWAYDEDATEPDFSAANNWTIPDLNAQDGFFSEGYEEVDGTRVRTLYAVWKAKSDARHVYVYKDVPAPGDQTREFEFTLNVSGTYHYRSSGRDREDPISAQGTFALAHGEYAELVSANSTTEGFISTVVTLYNADGTRKAGADSQPLAPIEVKAQSTHPYYQGSFGGSEKVTVTEGAVADYDTSMSRLSQVSNDYPLKLAENPDLTTIPLNDVAGNVVTWTNTDAGGSVVYKNQRQTYDIEVAKELVSNTSNATIFNFEASYEDNGVVTKLDDFTIMSGSVATLEGIPAGAILTITEKTDANDNYVTTATSGVGATDLDDAAKTFKFTISEDDRITFNNTLKSYPVTFRLVDQDGNTTISAMFSLASSIGSLGTDLYANAADQSKPGVFYTSNEFWADTYVLNQTTIPTGYIGLSGEVTLTVDGNGITSNNEFVTVTGDADTGFVITVKNWAQKDVTVKKVLSDPLLASTREFGFSYSYTSPVSGETVTDTFVLSPASNNADGASRTLKIPANATDFEVTELTSGNYSSVGGVYDTSSAGVKDEDGSALVDADTLSNYVFGIGRVEDDVTITYNNARKTSTVTVKKLVNDENDTTEFPFTAALLVGANAISGYTVYTDAADASNNLVTGADGSVAFALKHGEDIAFAIPTGAKLVVTEAVPAGYTPSASMVYGDGSVVEDGDTADQSFTVNSVDADGTITFTNMKGVPVRIVKIDQSGHPLEGAVFSISGDNITGELDLTSTIPQGGTDAVIYENDMLPAGTYTLAETGTPDGYLAPEGPTTITVAGSSEGITVTASVNGTDLEYPYVSQDHDTGVWTIKITNQSGYELPSTGGPGDGILYLVGGLMIACACVVLVRKRMT